MTLTFLLDYQQISRTDKSVVVAGSVNYLRAKFSPKSDDWKLPVTALFNGMAVLLDENWECAVPWEVVQQAGSFTVSAFCGSLQTANTVTVPVIASGYKNGETPPEPTPDVYNQVLGLMQEAKDAAETAQEAAGIAQDAAEHAPTIIDGVWHEWDAEAGEYKSTGTQAQGPEGERGPKGDKGDKGDRGDKGDKGDTGAQGPIGPTGETGPVGPKGDKGDTGAPGPQGEKGETGETGPQGPEGPQGPKGDPGEDAPQIDDAQITAANPWSSRKIVDTLCAPFTAEGNPVTCTPVEGYPLGVTVSWEPRQEGTGDPSPDNIRPITGMDEVHVTRRGVNLYNADALVAINGDADIYGYGVPADDLIIGKTYTVSVNAPIFSFKISDYINGYNSVSQDNIVDGKYTFVMVRDSNISNGTTQYVLVSTSSNIIYDLVSLPEQAKSLQISICAGEDAMPYAPYTGTTATLALPETIYGGTVDAVTGVGSKTWGYIASYNGESLPGEWTSDRDVYSAGATPTTGAQVAYKLATPEPIQATGSQSLLALPGTNTIYTDADSVTVTGRADPVQTINALTDRIAALEDAATGG